MGETESDGFKDTECGSNVLNQSGHEHTTCPTLHYITPHHTILHYTTLHHTILHYTTPYHTTPHHATLHDMTLHYFRGVKRSLTDYGVHSVAPHVFNQSGGEHITLPITTLHHTKLHYPTRPYTTVHYTTLQQRGETESDGFRDTQCSPRRL